MRYLFVLLLAGCAQASSPPMPPAIPMTPEQIRDAGLIERERGVYTVR